MTAEQQMKFDPIEIIIDEPFEMVHYEQILARAKREHAERQKNILLSDIPLEAFIVMQTIIFYAERTERNRIACRNN